MRMANIVNVDFSKFKKELEKDSKNIIHSNNSRTIDTRKIARGDIWLANLNNVKNDGTSIQQGERAVIVISNDLCNTNCKFDGSILTVVPITSQLTKSKLPTHIELDIEDGVEKKSIVLCEQTTIIAKKDLINKFGKIDEDKLMEVENGVAIQMGVSKDMRFNEEKVYVILSEIDHLENIYSKIKDNLLLKIMNDKCKEINTYCKKFGQDPSKYLNSNNKRTA